MNTNWKEQSLEAAENERWTEPDFGDNLAQKLYALRQTPMTSLGVEDIRLLIEQGHSLPYLIPLAIGKLESNLFAEGDYYPGDLLQSVLNVDMAFWLANRPLWQQLHQLIMVRSYELEDRGIRTELFMELS
jgi:hypothetical protein